MDGNGFVLWLFVTFIGFAIIYFVIKTAIDSSMSTGELIKIRKLLEELVENGKCNKIIVEEDTAEILDTPYNICPACGAEVLAEMTKCPSCGLTLVK